ncbi:MAG: type II toxin-antitoxin system RelE/ParE family toxin [Actinobacteria bacterium]|nr:type II toxin-antitoxin system RelE/ParE family toxin [Actinomycetota bacterium]
MARIIYTESYLRRVKKFIRLHPDIISQYKKTLELLEVNPFHPSLRLHKLKGKLEKLCSISINISYRICVDFIIDEDKIILIDIGKHEDIY